MSDPHTAAQETPGTEPFTEAEVQEFHASDIYAARVIVLLMTGIFTIGLVLYSVVAIVV